MESLEGEFAFRRDAKGDINEHMETLRNLAAECDHVTEFGVRYGNSTIALLAAKPKRLVCYDILPQLHVQKQWLRGVQFDLITADTLQLSSIEQTDMLFIDTLHKAAQLRAELRLARFVRRYIVLHDTVTFRWHGEQTHTCQNEGLGVAVLEFLLQGEFLVQRHYENNNGLTILRRLTSGTRRA